MTTISIFTARNRDGYEHRRVSNNSVSSSMLAKAFAMSILSVSSRYRSYPLSDDIFFSISSLIIDPMCFAALIYITRYISEISLHYDFRAERKGKKTFDRTETTSSKQRNARELPCFLNNSYIF